MNINEKIKLELIEARKVAAAMNYTPIANRKCDDVVYPEESLVYYLENCLSRAKAGRLHA